MPALELTSTETRLNQFLKAFEEWCLDPKPLNEEEIASFICKDAFILINNGEVTLNNFADYLKLVENFRRKISHYKNSGLLKAPLFIGKQAVIEYKLEFNCKEEQKMKKIYVMAIVELQDEVITSWNQVTHYQNWFNN